jgi:hypothetical protein
MAKQTGQCLCGSIKFEITGELAQPHACHCTQCVKQSGHFAVSTHVKRADFKLTEEKGLKWYQSSDYARRGFCQDCGSAIFWDGGDEDLYISMGSLHGSTGLRVANHIFVDEKPDHYEISDDLPKFAGYDQPLD